MERFKFLPKTPGVYIFKAKKDTIYIGKAVNIQARVKSHFKQPSYRDKLFIEKVEKVKFLKTNSEIDALILEASLIKKHQPKFNVVWRDDKNYFYVAIEKNAQKIPYISITHQKDRLPMSIQYIGPFVEGAALKKVLKYLRRPFPYYTSARHPKTKCTWCHLDLCPGRPVTLGEPRPEGAGPYLNLSAYKRNVHKLVLILKGKKSRVLSALKKEMLDASKNQNYEKAGRIRDQIQSLENIFAHTHIINEISNFKFPASQQGRQILNSHPMGRVECYDISNIQGKFATGSMVVFINGKPDKNQYRKFKIKLNSEPNDIAMLKEVLQRRFSHPEWPYPDAILIDGGKAQLNAGINSKPKNQNIKIISIAKGRQDLFIEGQKNPIPLKDLPQEVYNLIKSLDDEAHRFAITYHKKLRKKNLLQ